MRVLIGHDPRGGSGWLTDEAVPGSVVFEVIGTSYDGLYRPMDALGGRAVGELVEGWMGRKGRSYDELALGRRYLEGDV